MVGDPEVDLLWGFDRRAYAGMYCVGNLRIVRILRRAIARGRRSPLMA